MEINKPIVALISLVIALIVLFLFVAPKFRESSDLQAKLLTKQSEYSGKSMYYEKLSDIFLDIDKRKDVLQKVDDALPSNVSFSSLTYFLQKTASESGLIIKSITFLEIPASGYSQSSPTSQDQSLSSNSINNQVKDITFTIEISGNYQGLKNFLSSLEKSSRLFEMDTISFSTASAEQSTQGQPKLENQSQTYGFNLTVKTHSY